MLGDEPASCSWSRGKVNVGKATFILPVSVRLDAVQCLLSEL
jgi:hypothetical protein